MYGRRIVLYCLQPKSELVGRKSPALNSVRFWEILRRETGLSGCCPEQAAFALRPTVVPCAVYIIALEFCVKIASLTRNHVVNDRRSVPSIARTGAYS